MKTVKEILSDITEYLVDINDFEPIKKIGEGACGIVYLSIHKPTGIYCAVKKLLSNEIEGQDVIYFCREVKILSRCSSFFLLPLMGFTYTAPFLIVTEFMKCGSLFDALHHKPNAPTLTNTEKTCIAMGIAHGMMKLHHMKIIHRDLKSLNILLDDRHLPKICDFGIARFVDDACTLVTQQIGTTQWMAPEQLMTSKYTNKVDVYAFGVLLWEIITEDIPFQGLNQYQITINVTQKNLRPKIPSTTPKKLRQMVELCWHSDPNKRPSFKQIYKAFSRHALEFPDTDRDYVDQIVAEVEGSENDKSAFDPLAKRNQISTEEYQTIEQDAKRTYKPQESLVSKFNFVEKPQTEDDEKDDEKEEEEEEEKEEEKEKEEKENTNAEEDKNEEEEKEENKEDSVKEEEDINEDDFGKDLNEKFEKITPLSVKEFYESVEPYIQKDVPSAKRTICLRVIGRIAEKSQKLIEPLLDTNIFSQLPLDSTQDFPYISKIISAIIAVRPSVITPSFVEDITKLANSCTPELLHLFSKYVLVASTQEQSFEVISQFLVVSSSYLTRGYTQDFVRILAYILNINSTFAYEFTKYSQDLLTYLLKNGNSEEIEFALNALTQVADIIKDIPINDIMSHIETHSESVITYLLASNIVPTVEIVNSLLRISPVTPLAIVALCKYAEDYATSALFLIARGWLERNCPEEIALRIFLSILVVPTMRIAIMEVEGVPEMLTRLAQRNNPVYLQAIAISISKINMSQQIANKLSKAGFINAYLQATVVSGDTDLVNAGFTVSKKIADVAITSEMLTLAEIIPRFINPVNTMTIGALELVLLLAKYSECITVFNEKGLIDALNQAEIPEEYEKLKQDVYNAIT